jgi:hypothetical protein
VAIPLRDGGDRGNLVLPFNAAFGEPDRRSWTSTLPSPLDALLILEGRLKEQEAEGVGLPKGMDWPS